MVEDIKKCLIQSQSIGPLDLGEMRKLLPSQLQQCVNNTGDIYKLRQLFLEQIRAGVFLIIIITDNDNRFGRILAKVSRILIPSLKEACQNVIRSWTKIPEKVEKLNLPNSLKEELCTQFQWLNTTNRRDDYAFFGWKHSK